MFANDSANSQSREMDTNVKAKITFSKKKIFNLGQIEFNEPKSYDFKYDNIFILKIN